MVQSIVISNGNAGMTVVPLLSSADVLPFLEGGLRASFPPFVLFFPRFSELSDSELPDVSEEEEEEISNVATVKIKINIVLTRGRHPNFIAYFLTEIKRNSYKC